MTALPEELRRLALSVDTYCGEDEDLVCIGGYVGVETTKAVNALLTRAASAIESKDKALLAALDCCTQYFEEAGPCDHSTNICVCDIGTVLTTIRAALPQGSAT